MIKYELLPEKNKLGENNVVHLSGLTKTASYASYGEEIRNYISSLSPKPNKAYLLISALGDENWGSNSNADMFPTEGLSNPTDEYGFTTYVKHGNWFHNHENKDAEKSFGKPVFAYWNKRMGRVELIVEVDLLRDHRTRKALENDETIQTSMGSYVNYDICTICHPNWKEFYKIPEPDMVAISESMDIKEIHDIGKKYGVDLTYIHKLNPPVTVTTFKDGKAIDKVYEGGPEGLSRHPKMYCSHMRFSRNRILPTGERVCVVNLRPVFFDISFVNVNADKSSFVLAKVASDMSVDLSIDDATLLHRLNKLSADKLGMEKEITGDVVSADHSEISDYYKDIICPDVCLRERELPDSLVDAISEKYSLDDILRTFLHNGMYPHPREFFRMYMISTGNKDKLADADRQGLYLTPEILSECTSSGKTIDLDCQPNKELSMLLSKYASERSHFYPDVVKRIEMIKKANPVYNPYYIGEKPDWATEQIKNKSLAGSFLPALILAAGAHYLAKPVSVGQAMSALGKTIASQGMKLAGITSAVAPTIGTYLFAGNAINKAREGKSLNKIEKTVASHPLLTSVGLTAFVANPKGMSKGVADLTGGISKGLWHMVKKSYDMIGSFDISSIPDDDKPEALVCVYKILSENKK